MLPVRDKIPHVAVRIRFEKTGALQYISHLDLHRTFSRLLVRKGVPVWYSEGFTPHPRLVFATPLSVGAESLCEYMDVFVVGSAETVDPDVLRWKLTESDIDGLKVTAVYFPETKFSTITHSDYTIRIRTAGADVALAERCEAALRESPLVVRKRTKSGEKDVDISAQIRLDLRGEGCGYFRAAPVCRQHEFLKSRVSCKSAEREVRDPLGRSDRRGVFDPAHRRALRRKRFSIIRRKGEHHA